jgi:hypothetical protein
VYRSVKGTTRECRGPRGRNDPVPIQCPNRAESAHIRGDPHTSHGEREPAPLRATARNARGQPSPRGSPYKQEVARSSRAPPMNRASPVPAAVHGWRRALST